LEGRCRDVLRLRGSRGSVCSRAKRVRVGPVFPPSALAMGRWREMGQREVDILSEEVGLKPVALPEMKEKVREKLDRLQRKAAKPLARGERNKRVLRPAGETGETRASRGDGAARGSRSEPARREGNRGTPVAER